MPMLHTLFSKKTGLTKGECAIFFYFITISTDEQNIRKRHLLPGAFVNVVNDFLDSFTISYRSVSPNPFAIIKYETKVKIQICYLKNHFPVTFARFTYCHPSPASFLSFPILFTSFPIMVGNPFSQLPLLGRYFSTSKG